MATLKQKAAIDKVVENGGNVSKAMKEAGYSVATAKTPQKLTESKAWIEIMGEQLPDEMLLKVHKEGLNASKQIVVEGVPLDIEQPDYATRHKYLDTAYKLKGSYAPEKTVNLNVNAEIKVDPKTQAIADEYENKLRESILGE